MAYSISSPWSELEFFNTSCVFILYLDCYSLCWFFNVFRCCERWSRPPSTSVPCNQLDCCAANATVIWFISGLLLQWLHPRCRSTRISCFDGIWWPLHPAAVDAKRRSQHSANHQSGERNPERGGDNYLQHCEKWYILPNRTSFNLFLSIFYFISYLHCAASQT